MISRFIELEKEKKGDKKEGIPSNGGAIGDM
jgi:hypothetical protein